MLVRQLLDYDFLTRRWHTNGRSVKGRVDTLIEALEGDCIGYSIGVIFIFAVFVQTNDANSNNG